MSTTESGDAPELKQCHQEDGQDVSAQVHSANSWETADLGDKKRNEKFLKLMGASKKEHHGKFVIGDKSPTHKRERRSENLMKEQLEGQFTAGMEHRLAGGRKGHLGLGFHETDTEKQEDVKSEETDKDNSETPAAATGKPFADVSGVDAVEEGAEDAEVVGGEDNATESEDGEKSQRKRECTDEEEKDEVKKMKFVKSDS